MRKPLVLIGYSACPRTRLAFEQAGCEAWTCDVLPSRGDDQSRHILGDVWDAIRSREWDFGVFHPMCTYLTVSAAWAFKDPDFKKYPGIGYHQRVKAGTITGAARRAQREIEIENFRKLLELPFPVVLENPALNFINTAIRGPTDVVHPYQFGDDASKATGLWFGDVARARQLPRLARQQCLQVSPRWVQGKGGPLPRWANQTDSGQNNLTPGDDRWLLRSETYPGIAHAIGTQWGRWLNRPAPPPGGPIR